MQLAHKKEGEQGIGRSREGYTSKIHVLVDGLGNLLRVCLTSGQRHDSTQLLHLIGDFKFENLLADRGYAGQEIVQYLVEQGIKVVIPPHQCAKTEREYDNSNPLCWRFCPDLTKSLVENFRHFILQVFDQI